MCDSRNICNATLAAWQARPELTDTLELYAVGFEAARANREDAALSDILLGETILMHAARESARRRTGAAHACA